MGKGLADHPGRRLQIHIALFVSELVIDSLQVIAVKHDNRKFQPVFLFLETDGIVQPAEGNVKGRFVLDACQCVRVGPAVQVADIHLQMVPHLPEGLCQYPDFIVAVIVQFCAVIAGDQLLGCGGKPLQRFGNGSHDKHGQQRKHHKDGDGDQHNGPRHPLPGGEYLFHRRNYHQLQPVGQRGKRNLAPLPFRIVPDQFPSVVIPAEEFRVQVRADFLHFGS